MIWLTKLFTIGSLLVLFLFQNCSSSHNESGQNSNSSFDISKIYPYFLIKPVYFDNIQLTAVAQVDGVWSYQFVASAVDVDNPEQNIDVNIQIRDQDEKLLCLSKTVRVNITNNIIPIDDCNSSKQVEEIQMKIFIKSALTTAYPKDPINTYNFKIAPQ